MVMLAPVSMIKGFSSDVNDVAGTPSHPLAAKTESCCHSAVALDAEYSTLGG